MNTYLKSVVLIASVYALASGTSLAESLERPQSITKALQDKNLSTGKRAGGAHGSKSPHAKLSPEQHVQIALQHKAEGRIGEAFRSLDEAISRNPVSPELFAVRGSLYLERQNISEALNDLESALKLAPDSAAILTNRAQAYRHFGRINEALTDLNKAIELKPDLLAARFNRGSIHYSSNEFELARQDFDACIAIDPHTAGPYFNRAAAKDALGDRPGAVDDIKRFIDIAASSEWKQTAQKLLEKWESGETIDKYSNKDS
jgi:tetratricopeptide (TPR) repeat protein